MATQCDGGCLGAVGDTQLVEDTGDVESHSGRAYHQLLRYLGVALPLRDQIEYPAFSLRQAVFLRHRRSRRVLNPCLFVPRVPAHFADVNNYAIDSGIVEKVISNRIDHTPRAVLMPYTQLRTNTSAVSRSLDHLGEPMG